MLRREEGNAWQDSTAKGLVKQMARVGRNGVPVVEPRELRREETRDGHEMK